MSRQLTHRWSPSKQSSLRGHLPWVNQRLLRDCLWYQRFNLRDIVIDWSVNIIQGHQSRNQSLNNFSNSKLKPELDLAFPTRDNNIVDLFLARRPQLLNRCTDMSAIPGIIDRHAIFVDRNMSAPGHRPPKCTIMIYMWKKANINLQCCAYTCRSLFQGTQCPLSIVGGDNLN